MARNIQTTAIILPFDESQAGKDKTRMAVCCNKPNGGANTGGSKGFLKLSSTNVAAQRSSQGTISKGKTDVKPDGKIKESKKMLGIDLGAAKDNTLSTVSAKIFNCNSVDLEQRNHEASYCNMHLLNSVSSCRIQNDLIGISHGKVNHKRAQKLRFVEDIMKIEEAHISKKKRPSDGSEYEAQLGDFSSNSLSQNSKLVHAQNSYNSTRHNHNCDGLEYNQNKEEGLSLMNWLKKASKKIVTDDFGRKKALSAKEYVEIRDMNKKVAIHHDILSDKDVNPIQHGSKVKECNKEYTLVKENEASSVKSSGEKARRKKLYGIEDKDFSQLNCPEKKIRKKQRTIKAVGKETLDDIPMDIVELLDKNQQERNLVDTYFIDESKHEVLMTQGEMRHVNDSYASGHYGEKVSNAKYKSNGVPNDTGYNIPTASCDNQNTDCGASKSVECQKQILIDLNEKAAEFLTIPHWNGQRPCTSDLPVDSVKIYSNQNSSCRDFLPKVLADLPIIFCLYHCWVKNMELLVAIIGK